MKNQVIPLTTKLLDAIFQKYKMKFQNLNIISKTMAMCTCCMMCKSYGKVIV